jgi:hypothetical protein
VCRCACARARGRPAPPHPAGARASSTGRCCPRTRRTGYRWAGLPGGRVGGLLGSLAAGWWWRGRAAGAAASWDVSKRARPGRALLRAARPVAKAWRGSDAPLRPPLVRTPPQVLTAQSGPSALSSAPSSAPPGGGGSGWAGGASPSSGPSGSQALGAAAAVAAAGSNGGAGPAGQVGGRAPRHGPAQRLAARAAMVRQCRSCGRWAVLPSRPCAPSHVRPAVPAGAAPQVYHAARSEAGPTPGPGPASAAPAAASANGPARRPNSAAGPASQPAPPAPYRNGGGSAVPNTPSAQWGLPGQGRPRQA